MVVTQSARITNVAVGDEEMLELSTEPAIGVGHRLVEAVGARRDHLGAARESETRYVGRLAGDEERSGTRGLQHAECQCAYYVVYAFNSTLAQPTFCDAEALEWDQYREVLHPVHLRRPVWRQRRVKPGHHHVKKPVRRGARAAQRL